MRRSIAHRAKLNIYKMPSSFLSMRVAMWLLVLILISGILGFKLIENYSWSDALYMTIITVSTVGYTEVKPLSEAGKTFTSIFIILNVGVFAYILSVFSYFVIEGEIFKKMHLNLIGTHIKKLSNHVILCGYGRYGKEAATHFQKHGIPFVVIEKNSEKITLIQESNDKILYLQEDATQDESLLEAGIAKAGTLITALSEDSDNVFTVLTARQLNPGIDIISVAKDPKSEKKLLLAGANHVVMPEQIGGFYMATLVTKPGAIDFFSFITNEYQSDISFEEISYEELPAKFKGKSIRELELRQITGTNVIGYRKSDGKYKVNPSPDMRLTPNASLIVLGNQQQLDALREYLKG